MTLVMHFNAFNGRLIGGYLKPDNETKGWREQMTPQEVIAYLTANPLVKCDPLKV